MRFQRKMPKPFTCQSNVLRDQIVNPQTPSFFLLKAITDLPTHQLCFISYQQHLTKKKGGHQVPQPYLHTYPKQPSVFTISPSSKGLSRKEAFSIVMVHNLISQRSRQILLNVQILKEPGNFLGKSSTISNKFPHCNSQLLNQTFPLPPYSHLMKKHRIYIPTLSPFHLNLLHPTGFLFQQTSSKSFNRKNFCQIHY